ncbi:MAG: hypothetical protein ACD_30C00112G0089 [uncultured bacterium]|uniref:Uncharacterized protein n=3 Tax=Candidatus Daviesiibacteriota TaxID=1752718 RepID=A0A0G0HZZ5_9BACT|nr:MAG: hypothetical protein ACD_30C00112G0089 [uncultured bacterium]KKQ09431.1 MAG: hypothetical protein US19_C0014G0003 [Candidatus Daviesbacteria bacterium GW2011_GWB1_36_5]OGE17248.1 MAG: hypothetical protein A2858_00905 [Candidatus Daviesbacteria bacterium RIFCSPHIGHO2_01_FULL_36_37]OGE36029.1 MAG: hypothetical protein A3E66_01900 [Candidatus Daviesbacteria bacterium RIFCSPHIGHO2_12_FULL_37_16]
MVTPEIEKHLKANENMKKRDIVLGNFLGGLSWGVGSAIGATVVVAIILGLLGQLNFIPGVGDIVNQVQPIRNTRTIEK